MRELIHLLKYEQVRPASAALGRMLAAAIRGLEPGWTENPVVVVPVPLHARKLRQRGFNQSELIAHCALKLGAGSGRLVLRSRILERRRETQSHIGLTRHQRRENLRGSFVVTRPGEIAGRARVLRRAGASKVFVATVARTLKADAKAVDRTQAFAGDEWNLAATG
jgi:predicted amidophosphoribosyltransferase